MKDNAGLKKVAFWVLLVVIVCFFVFPIFWVYLTSFKTNEAIRSMSPFSFKPTIENYKMLFQTRRVDVPFINSLIISGVSTIVVMLISIPAAYSFAR